MAKTLGLYSIVFHAAYYMGMDKEDVYKKVQDGFSKIMEVVDTEKINTFLAGEQK